MGRKKLEIKLIEDKSARQVTFSKRRNGLLKKAKELSVLCDLDIAVVIYSCRGKLYHYCSSNSLAEILERYNSHVDPESSPSAGDSEEHVLCGKEDQSQVQIREILNWQDQSKYSRFLTCEELLQTVESEVGHDQLSVTDLVHLENQIETALSQARAAKTSLLMDSMSSLHEKEKMLAEEKRLLEEKVAGSKRMNKRIIDLNVTPDSRVTD